MKEGMWKYFSANLTQKYIDVLKMTWFISPFSSIKMTPTEAS